MKMKSTNCSRVALLLSMLLIFLTSLYAQAQSTISGEVKDEDGNPLIGANVVLKGTNKGALTDVSGKFSIGGVAQGKYTLVVSFVGNKTVTQEVDVNASEVTVSIVSGSDPLALDEVIVTGTFDQRTKLESSVAITTLNSKSISMRAPRGTGDLLLAIPGNFVDNSAGEVEAKIYPRGLVSANSGNGTGFRYVSLQEDGLPVMGTLLGFSAPDFYHRADATVGRLEAIRGGSASITSANSPGGIYNFISKEGGQKFGGELKVNYGLYGGGRALFRTELNIGGPIAKGWTYNLGGFYRTDDGGRITPFKANEGGQVKFNLVKNSEKGKIKFYFKYLNDRVLTYRNLPIMDLTSTDAWAGWNLNTGTTIGAVRGTLPDPENFNRDRAATRSWNANNGNKVQTFAAGFEFIRELGNGFTLSNNMKYSNVKNRYNQITAEQVLPTNALDGLGGVIMRDVATGSELYNFSAANPTGRVNQLGNFFMLTAPLDMRNEISDFQNLLTITKKAGKHSLAFGGYFASTSGKSRWDGDLLAQALEPNPRSLQIQTNNPFRAATGNTPLLLDYTDATGFWSYGSITYVGFKDRVTTSAIFLNDVWAVSDKFNIDLGIRYEAINHNGQKERWNRPALGTLPLPAALATVNQIGADGRYGTRYDVDMRIGTGNFFDFNFTHAYFSGSMGLNYKISDKTAVYARYTRGNKAPDMDFYINNYVNVPLLKGPEEKINSGELGFKTSTKDLSLSATAFLTQMSDVPYTILISNTVTGESFYTPPTFNKLRTLGLELEANYRPVSQFNISFTGTFQSAEFTDFKFYNVNGFQHPVFIGETYTRLNPSTGTPYLFPDNRLTPSFPQGTPNSPIAEGTPSYHRIEDLSGKKVDNLPSVMLDITPSVIIAKKFNVFLNVRYTGERQYNKQNVLTLPAYTVLNGGINATFGKFDVGVTINNLTNSVAIIQADGLGRPGAAGIDAIKAPDLTAHKAAGFPFWGRPLLPRLTTISVAYRF
jgi:iron complex outermembrane recepter protein